MSVTSGELFARDPSENNSWKNTLEAFSNLIDRSAVDATRRHNTALNEITSSLQCAANMHRYNMKSMKCRLGNLDSKIDTILNQSDLLVEKNKMKSRSEMEYLEERLLEMASKYAASVEKECCIIKNRLKQQDEIGIRKVKNMEATLSMEEFGLHVSHETNRQVEVARLLPDNPQYIRCKRAATDNVKAHFFGSSSDYSGINVLNVFKIENKPLLRAFQRQAVNLKPGSVKGLFCDAPDGCIEKVVVQGMFNDDFGRKLFQQKVSIPGHDTCIGKAKERYESSISCPFPTTFSKYSTLQGAFLNGDSPKYLLLCRVIVGDVFVTSNGGFPAVDHRGKFDSMYSSSQEEYLMLNPAAVLPEFIIRYDLVNRYSSSCDFDNYKSSLIEPDFSSGYIEESSFEKPSWIIPRFRPINVEKSHALKQLVRTAEIQAGKKRIHENAKDQRENLWKKIVQTLNE